MFSNPFFHALRTEHSHLAIGSPLALRYPADVIPFAALAKPTEEAMLALSEILAPGEVIYVTGEDIPEIAKIEKIKELPARSFTSQRKKPVQPQPAIRSACLPRLMLPPWSLSPM